MQNTRFRSLNLRCLLGVSLVLFALAAPAMAAGGGGENNIFAGDLGNILWTLIAFFLVIFILGKFAWGPMLGVIEQREKLIHDSLAEAKRDRKAAEARLKEYEDRLNEARSEATKIVEEGHRDADVVRERIEQEARAESEKMVARAKREIELARESAIREIYDLSGSLATSIASKIVGRELQDADHKRLIEEAIDEIGRLETN